MIVEVMDMNWSVNESDISNYYVSNEDGIVEKLNHIIDWKKSRFPIAIDKDGNKIYKKDFLGETPKLKSGNCFNWDGSIYYVFNDDTIVLAQTLTGGRAINRLKERILTEYLWQLTNVPEDLKVEFTAYPHAVLNKESVKKVDLKENTGIIVYDVLEEMKKFALSDLKSTVIKVTMNSEDFDGLPVELYIDNHIYYDTEELDDVCSKLFAKTLLSWAVRNLDTLD